MSVIIIIRLSDCSQVIRTRSFDFTCTYAAAFRASVAHPLLQFPFALPFVFQLDTLRVIILAGVVCTCAFVELLICDSTRENRMTDWQIDGRTKPYATIAFQRKCQRERERERERKRERERDRDRERQRQRQTDRQTDTQGWWDPK